MSAPAPYMVSFYIKFTYNGGNILGMNSPVGSPVSNAIMTVSVDNVAKVVIENSNNSFAKENIQGWNVNSFAVPLVIGDNYIEIRVSNEGSAPNPAGVIATIQVNGQSVLDTGSEWSWLPIQNQADWDSTSLTTCGGI